MILDIIEATGFRSVSDYGAGKCRLGTALQRKVKKLDYYPFDPAFPEYGSAKPADLVACIDVLEHIELEYLDRVIMELASITNKIGFFSIHTGPARKVLDDGRNAHLIQQPPSWWLEKLLPYFDVIQLAPVKRGFWVIVQKKGKNYADMFVRKPDYATFSGKMRRWLRRLVTPL